MLNEIDLKKIKKYTSHHVKNIATETKSTFSKTKKVLTDEFIDNIEAFNVLRDKFKDEDSVDSDEFKKALEQLFIDNAKLLTIAGIGIMPGSALTLPLVMNIAKKLGINLIPSKTYEK